MKQLQRNPNCFEKAKVRGLFSFLVNYPPNFIRTTSIAFVANEWLYDFVAFRNELYNVLADCMDDLTNNVQLKN